MRTDLRRSRKSLEEEKDFGERRRELSGGGSRAFERRESESFRKNGCLIIRIVEIEIANRK
jgi:hypothetical protein